MIFLENIIFFISVCRYYSIIFKDQFWTTCSFCHKTVSLQRTCSNLFGVGVIRARMFQNWKRIIKRKFWNMAIMLPEMQNRRSAQELYFPLTKVCCMNMKVEPINNSLSSDLPRDLFCSTTACVVWYSAMHQQHYMHAEKFGDLHTKQLWRICFYPF